MDFSPDALNGIAMEGYLYKRASNAFKTWSRYSTSAICDSITEIIIVKQIINMNTYIYLTSKVIILKTELIQKII